MNNLYLIVRDADGLVVNAIEYDGDSPYDPGEGMALYPWDEGARPWVGWTRNPDGTWTVPPPFPSWTLDENGVWQPPVPMPAEGEWYWNEDSLSWVDTQPSVSTEGAK